MTRGKPVEKPGQLGYRRSRVRVLSFHDETDQQKRIWALEKEIARVKKGQADPKELRAAQEEAARLRMKVQYLEDQNRGLRGSVDALQHADRYLQGLESTSNLVKQAMAGAQSLPKNAKGAKELWTTLVAIERVTNGALKPARPPCPIHDESRTDTAAYCLCKARNEEDARRIEKLKMMQQLLMRAQASGMIIEDDE
jgi:hypothetical protein